MDNDRLQRLRDYLKTIAPPGGMEEIASRTLPAIEESLTGPPTLAGLEAVAPMPAPPMVDPSVGASALTAVRDDEPLSPDEADFLEAIILPAERPVVDIIDNSFAVPGPPFEHLGQPPYRSTIESVIPSVGRVELPGHPFLPYGGTAFVVGDGLLMTNRHVAELFSAGLGRENLTFLTDRQAGVDFRQERNHPESTVLQVEKVLMIHPYWDMALLSVTGLSGHPPLRLTTAPPGDLSGREVVVIGYPALDPRNNVALQTQIFGGQFNIKRLQPGRIMGETNIRSFAKLVLAQSHDCSTLGGNSGSAVVDVESGTVLALHFAGTYLEANYSVPGHALSIDGRVVDAGVRFDAEPAPAGPTQWESYWQQADPAAAPESSAIGAPSVAATATATATASAGQRVTFTIPLEISVRLGG